LSPRAAWRLESLGFDQVYDYVGGKLDWLAAGLPSEGTNTTRPRAGDVARRDVPTCRLEEPMHAVRERVAAAGWNACVVVNEVRVVMGLLRAEELQKGRDERVERVMRPGPSTFRPHVPADDVVKFMVAHDLPNSPITTSDGKLIGLLRREDVTDSKNEGR
jgi:CBS domain-containing protein